MRPPGYIAINEIGGHIPSRRLRAALYRSLGARLDPTATIMLHTQVLAQRSLSIGARSIIGQFCLVDARGGISIAEDVNISSFAKLITASHDVHSDDFHGITGGIAIEDHVWIASGAIILPGVSIGRGSVVGAQAVVTGPIPPMTVVAGAPARKVGERHSTLEYRLQGVPRWH